MKITICLNKDNVIFEYSVREHMDLAGYTHILIYSTDVYLATVYGNTDFTTEFF